MEFLGFLMDAPLFQTNAVRNLSDIRRRIANGLLDTAEVS